MGAGENGTSSENGEKGWILIMFSKWSPQDALMDRMWDMNRSEIKDEPSPLGRCGCPQRQAGYGGAGVWGSSLGLLVFDTPVTSPRGDARQAVQYMSLEKAFSPILFFLFLASICFLLMNTGEYGGA